MENYLKFHTAQHPRILQLSEHTLIRTISHCTGNSWTDWNWIFQKSIHSSFLGNVHFILMLPKHSKFATFMQNYQFLYYNSVIHTGKVRHEQVHSFHCISSALNMLLTFTRIKVTESNLVTDNLGTNTVCLFVCALAHVPTWDSIKTNAYKQSAKKNTQFQGVGILCMATCHTSQFVESQVLLKLWNWNKEGWAC
jgi:hypothetical protein